MWVPPDWGNRSNTPFARQGRRTPRVVQSLPRTSEISVRFSLTPKETSFYDMFAAAAENLVVGSKLLLELLGSDVSARAEIVELFRELTRCLPDAGQCCYQDALGWAVALLPTDERGPADEFAPLWQRLRGD